MKIDDRRHSRPASKQKPHVTRHRRAPSILSPAAAAISNGSRRSSSVDPKTAVKGTRETLGDDVSDALSQCCSCSRRFPENSSRPLRLLRSLWRFVLLCPDCIFRLCPSCPSLLCSYCFQLLHPPSSYLSCRLCSLHCHISCARSEHRLPFDATHFVCVDCCPSLSFCQQNNGEERPNASWMQNVRIKDVEIPEERTVNDVDLATKLHLEKSDSTRRIAIDSPEILGADKKGALWSTRITGKCVLNKSPFDDFMNFDVRAPLKLHTHGKKFDKRSCVMSIVLALESVEDNLLQDGSAEKSRSSNFYKIKYSKRNSLPDGKEGSIRSHSLHCRKNKACELPGTSSGDLPSFPEMS